MSGWPPARHANKMHDMNALLPPTPTTRTLTLRGRRHRLLHWGDTDAPMLFLLHGWMDCAETFSFIAEDLTRDWQLVAPDWRGFGHSQWNDGPYFFPDYLADLDALLEALSPATPARIAGHSMGAMIAGLYAGARPERVARLALMEGFGLNATEPGQAPGRYARWLAEQRTAPAFQAPASLEALAARLLARNPRMHAEHARLMARALTRDVDGALAYRADPWHKGVNPALYRLEEAKACWRAIACPVLWVIGGDQGEHPMAKGVQVTLDARRACFARLSEVTVANAGHMLQWEQPAAVAAALAGFFAQG